MVNIKNRKWLLIITMIIPNLSVYVKIVILEDKFNQLNLVGWAKFK